MGPNSERRITCSTGLPTPSDDAKDYATIRPKLHVAEIISIQASERLAEILEPVYETIQNGIVNEGYDSLDRSDADDDSGFIANRENKVDDYYGFTNASSISINCQDWIQCASTPSSSVYNNSLNDYESKYIEKKYPNQTKLRDISEDREKNSDQIIPKFNSFKHRSVAPNVGVEKEIGPDKEPVTIKPDKAGYDDCANMLEEIMQYIDTTDTASKDTLDPSVLAPNRPDGDKIVFLNE